MGSNLLSLQPLFFVSFVVFVVSDGSWLCEELVDFIVVSFEWVAHDQKVAAVVRDRVPVNHVGLMSILKIGDSAGAA
jgi:hypothetical protein